MSREILRYRPKHAPAEWDAVADGVRMVVAAVADNVPYPLMTVLRVTAMLAIRAEQAGLPRDPSVWLDQSTISRYLIGDTDLAPRTTEKYASILARIREALVWVERGEAARPRLRADRSRSAPYSTSELARLEVWAGLLPPTAPWRANAQAALALCAGCGLTPRELLQTRGTGICVLPSGAVLVQVPGSERLVICRSLWEETLAELAAAAGSDFLFAPNRERPEGGKNLIGNWARRMRSADPNVPLVDLRRLRCTWIVSLLRERVPPDLIARAAGLASTAALASYQVWVPEPTRDAEIRLLRGWA